MFESIRNYYEQLVTERVAQEVKGRGLAVDSDFLEDVVCVALNTLPPRYVRFAVDASFYLTSQQREEMERRVEAAVGEAIELVSGRRRRDEGG